jgi:hypothetical protein
MRTHQKTSGVIAMKDAIRPERAVPKRYHMTSVHKSTLPIRVDNSETQIQPSTGIEREAGYIHIY